MCGKPQCHLLVGHLNDFKSYNPKVVEDSATWLIKIKSRKYDLSIMNKVIIGILFLMSTTLVGCAGNNTPAPTVTETTTTINEQGQAQQVTETAPAGDENEVYKSMVKETVRQGGKNYRTAVTSIAGIAEAKPGESAEAVAYKNAIAMFTIGNLTYFAASVLAHETSTLLN